MVRRSAPSTKWWPRISTGEYRPGRAELAWTAREGAPEPQHEELKELIRSRLRSSRLPDKIVFVSELPYNEMGKLLRREVKKILAG